MEKLESIFEYYIEGLFLFIIAIVGVFGNLSFILIFSCSRKNLNTFHRYSFLWNIVLTTWNLFQFNDLPLLLWHRQLGFFTLHFLFSASLANDFFHLFLHKVNHNSSSVGSCWIEWYQFTFSFQHRSWWSHFQDLSSSPFVLHLRGSSLSVILSLS